MRSAAVVLFLLSSFALSAKPKLDEVWDLRKVPLNPYGWEEWEKLPKKTRLKSRGIDPTSWEDPPPIPLTPEEKKKKEEAEARRKANPNAPKQYPTDRFAGFRFDDRMKKKQALFNELVDGLPSSSVAGLIKKLTQLDKIDGKYEKEIAEHTELFLRAKDQLDRSKQQQIDRHMKKHGKPPTQVMVSRKLMQQYQSGAKKLQRMLSLQESERQFQAWMLRRFAELVRGFSPDEQVKPVRALEAGMKHKDWRQRVRCATILAHLGGDVPNGVFDAAMGVESDPFVLAEMIRLRAKSRPDGLLAFLTARLESADWQVRATVYAELAKIKKKEVVDLLIARLANEEGRLGDDVVDALETLTGKRFDPDKTIWEGWWTKQRATWEPPKEGKQKGEKIVKEGGGKSVSFYGIKTHSKRLVFCLDISGSMAMPLDGPEGKKDPRIKSAKAQMERALRSLPKDAMFTIVTYSNTVSPWKKKLVPATDANKKRAWKWVEKIQPNASTNIYDALELSLQLAAGNKDASADTIFFMTDGVPTDGRIVDPSQILAEITQKNRRLGVVIHCIGVSKEQNAGFLLNLARANGGRYASKH